MNPKDIQSLAMAGPFFKKPSLPVKYYKYRKQAETVLTIPHIVEIVNFGGKTLISLYLACVTHTQKNEI